MSLCVHRCSYVIEDENKQEEQAAGLYWDSQPSLKVAARLLELSPDPPKGLLRGGGEAESPSRHAPKPFIQPLLQFLRVFLHACNSFMINKLDERKRRPTRRHSGAAGCHGDCVFTSLRIRSRPPVSTVTLFGSPAPEPVRRRGSAEADPFGRPNLPDLHAVVGIWAVHGSGFKM